MSKEKKVNVDKAVIEEAKQKAIDLYVLEEKFSKVKKSYESKKSRLVTHLKNFFYTMGEEKGFSFKCNEELLGGASIECRKITPMSVVFNAEKLEEKLGKELARNFVETKIEIVDWDGVVDLLKEHGVKPSEFKKLISVEKKVNTKALEQLEALGVVTKEDVKGCYKVNKKESYIRIRAYKKQEQEEDVD